MIWIVTTNPGLSDTTAQTIGASAIIVAGAAGVEEFSETFTTWAANWREACAAGDVRAITIGAEGDGNDRERLQQALETEPKQSPEPLWLVLLGHGTFDGKEGKFNLRGDDISSAELAAWLQPFQRPVVVIATFSSSGAFLGPVSAADRIVVTAARSGSENNFSRLGRYLSETIADADADLDHDGQTSLLEAWVSATQKVEDFYKSEGRLATEHSLLDDNGDARGTPSDWFSGIRVIKKTKDAAQPDGLRAHQIHLIASASERTLPVKIRAERDAIELEIAKLRETKASMIEDDYYATIEPLLLRLSRLYREAIKPERNSQAP